MSEPNEPSALNARIATAADIDAIAQTVALAFVDDPTWGHALRGADGATQHLAPFWRFFVESAVPHGWSEVVDGEAGEIASVALWLPPEVPELTQDAEAAVYAHVRASLDPEHVTAFFDLWQRFEHAHPDAESHAYLTVLATHPDHRGSGLAQRMVATRLRTLDAAGIPSYLESSNPDNDRRYARLGFERIGTIETVLEPITISTMWRAAVTPAGVPAPPRTARPIPGDRRPIGR